MLRSYWKVILSCVFLCIETPFAHATDIDNFGNKVASVIECVNAIKISGLEDSQVNSIRDKCLFDAQANEEDLLVLCGHLIPYLSRLNEKQTNNLLNIKNEIIDYLRSFKVTSYSFEIDPNIAFILDHQTPSFTVYYENGKGQVKRRKYDAKIWSIGLKAEFAIRVEIIKIISSGFNYYDSNKEIHLSKGIEFSLATGPGLNFLCCGFEDFDGGLVIAGVPLGISGGLSIVFGGSLVPVQDSNEILCAINAQATYSSC